MSQPSGVVQPVSHEPDKRDWIPIIVGAVVALLGGGILASIVNSLISVVNAPNVQIQIKPDAKHNGTTAWFLVKNIGQLAAKHVKLTISAPEEITRIYTFSTENMTLESPRPTILEANMQRLVKGEGSFVNISLVIKAKPNINYINRYVASVTYDEGSNKGGPSIEYPQYTTYIIYFIIYIAAAIVGIFYIRHLIRLRYQRALRYLQEELQSEQVTSDIDRLYRFKKDINFFYWRRRLHKTDYDYLINNIDRHIEKLKNFGNTDNDESTPTPTPTKSVHNETRDTSEVKPKTDENKS